MQQKQPPSAPPSVRAGFNVKPLYWTLGAISTAGIALLAGCGSGSSGGDATAQTSVNGTAFAPASQVALRPVPRSLFAMVGDSIFGGPANAAAPGATTPLAHATVTITVRGTTQTVASGFTNASGGFQVLLPAAAPDLSTLVVVVDNGKVTVKAAIPSGSPGNVNVDETTTVGEDAAEDAEAAGADPADADAEAQDIAQLQQQDENQNPGDVADVRDSGDDPNHSPQHLAQTLLIGNLGNKLMATLGQSQHSPSQRQSIMAALVYSRVQFSTPGQVFGVDWVKALVHGPATYTDAQIAAALQASGNTGATTASVDAALSTLNTTLGTSFTHARIPAAVFVLIALEPGSLQVASRTDMVAAVESLTGASIGTTNGGAGSAGIGGGGSIAGGGAANSR